jgi:imidazolonepropionase-like amidohydrolase
MIRSAWCALLVAGALAPPLHAQSTPRPIQSYALTNARIVVAPGRVIERGTVVLRAGRIVAVDAQVQAAAGALPLDMTGMTIYAGLIDAASSIGLPSATRQGGRGPGGGPPASFQQARQAEAAEGPPPELRPHQPAADVWAPTEAQRAAWRNAGVTTVGLAFDGGIFPGQTSAVSVAEGAPALRTPVSQQVLLGRRRGGYPSTLMGSYAFIEQAFLDAQHALRVEQAVQRDAASAPRPAYDPQAVALGPAARGTLPVWYHASAERDLERIIDLARRTDIENYVLVGAQEGFRAVEALKAMGRPVIVSLDWPQPDAVTGRAYELNVAPAAGPDRADAEADSAAQRALRGNAAALANGGVTIALSGYGLDSPAELREHVLAAVEAGLSPEAALRALTITPAQLLGLEALVGTVETGKLANLVVVEGDLFARTGRIRHVFVEGRHHEVAEPVAPARGQRRAEAGEEVSAAGEWAGSIEMAGATMPFTLTLTDADGALSGTIAAETGEVSLSGERTGDDIVLRGTFAPPGLNAMAFTITGTIAGADLRGTLTVQGQPPVPFNARRRDGGSGFEGGIR